MSIATVRERLVTILGDASIVSGIAGATKGVPRTLSLEDLPHVVITAGQATYAKLGSGIKKETRQYGINVLLKPWSTGIDLEAEELAETLVPLIREALYNRPSLTTVDSTDPLLGVQTSEPTGDTGIINLVFEGLSYAGFTITLPVEEYFQIIAQL